MPRKAAAPPPYELEAARWSDGAADAAPIAEDECVREVSRTQELTWVNIVAHDGEAAARLLAERFGFHKLEIEDALSSAERPHLHESEDHLFLSAPAVRLEGSKVFYAEVGFFIAPSLLVTVCRQRTAVIETWFGRWKQHAPSFGQHVAFLLHALLDAIVDEYLPAMDALEEQAERLESSIFKGRPVEVKELLRLKRRLLEMRRQLSPFRDIVNGLLRRDLTLIPDQAKPYYQDVYDHTLRVLESLDLNREIVASLLDAHLANVNNRLNEVMRLLTVIATILMTLALFTGWYGMNFKHMPELDWPWAYPGLLALMAGVVVLELWLFRRKGWL